MFVKLRVLLGQWLTAHAKQFGKRFYLFLALLVSVLIVLDANTSQLGLDLEKNTISYLTSNRVVSSSEQNITTVELPESLDHLEIHDLQASELATDNSNTPSKGKVITYIALSLSLTWLSAIVFYTKKTNTIAFMLTMTAAFIVSYITFNFFNLYVAVVAPICWALLYFILVKPYQMITAQGFRRWLAFGTHQQNEHRIALVMPILIKDLKKPLSDRQIHKVRRYIQSHSKTPCDVDAIKGIQTGIWGLFGDILMISWNVSAKNDAYLVSAQADTTQIIECLSDIPKIIGLTENNLVHYALHEAKVDRSLDLGAQWRIILAEAILKLDQISGADEVTPNSESQREIIEPTKNNIKELN